MKHDTNREPRTLILCFDGTADEFDDDNSNVVKFFSLLKKDDEEKQMCYYQAGPGTYFKPGVVSPLLHQGATALDMAIAWYLDAHVKDGYKFLMQNYRKGDKICLFGFSRGAYIARALAGFLTKCGLLLKDNFEQVSFAFKLYSRTDQDGMTLAAKFKESFCRIVSVEFVGVWDTVASVGLLRERTLPFTDSNRGIRTFRHALALDEHRGKFRPNLWHRPLSSSHSRKPSEVHEKPRGSPRASRLPSTSGNTLGLHLGPETGVASPPPSPYRTVEFREQVPRASSDSAASTVRNSLQYPSKHTRSSSQRSRVDYLRESESNDEHYTRHTTSSLSPPRDASSKLPPLPASPLLQASRPDGTTPIPIHRRAKSTTDRILSLPGLIRRHSDAIHRRFKKNDMAQVAREARDTNSIIVEPDVDDELHETDVLECWFTGSHADIGGGSVTNDTPHSLSNISLRWMIREVVSSQCGIMFDRRALDRLKVQKDILGSPRHAGPREKALDVEDIKAPIFDQLNPKRGISAWWLTEVIPSMDEWQTKSGEWTKKRRVNLGKGRKIRSTSDTPVNFHFTVRERMKTGYKPRAVYDPDNVVWIE